MMFKIEYDITTEHGIRTATFGFNFNSEWAAPVLRHALSVISSTLMCMLSTPRPPRLWISTGPLNRPARQLVITNNIKFFLSTP